jgi:hypothetical protein
MTDFEFMSREQLMEWIKANEYGSLFDEDALEYCDKEELFEIAIDIHNYNIRKEHQVEQLVIERGRDK